MDCPQCGGTLDTYALSDSEASVCEDCGYVGIAAEHRGDPRSVESWDDALRRFYRAHGRDGAPSVDLHPPLSRPAAEPTESWDDALRRFYARQDGDSSEETDEDESDAAETEDERDASEETADDESDTADKASDAEAEADVGQ
ncbi:hypothetical protein [Haloplanus sp. C73]|uniref:hypothetical protein n=1 Tax=Haloplanus sp. C73 TaxID=3421641 RepID=UPI003EBE83FC